MGEKKNTFICFADKASMRVKISKEDNGILRNIYHDEISIRINLKFLLGWDAANSTYGHFKSIGVNYKSAYKADTLAV